MVPRRYSPVNSNDIAPEDEAPIPVLACQGIWADGYAISMRIIGGEFRSRRILAPENNATRPITDRVKQSLFDILAPRIEGGLVYDCFAGTGSMGLECLSRGASRVTFFEVDRSAARLLRENITNLGVKHRSNVIDRDLFKWFQTNAPSQPADLVFLDPPYQFLRERPDDLRKLAAQLSARHLARGGVVVFRHDAADHLELPGLSPVDRREYGHMAIEICSPLTSPE